MKKNIYLEQLVCIFSIFILVAVLTFSFVYYNAESKKQEYRQKLQLQNDSLNLELESLQLYPKSQRITTFLIKRYCGLYFITF